MTIKDKIEIAKKHNRIASMIDFNEAMFSSMCLSSRGAVTKEMINLQHDNNNLQQELHAIEGEVGYNEIKKDYEYAELLSIMNS